MLAVQAPGTLLWPAAVVAWGPGYTSTLHRHHCVQLVMAVEGSISVRGAGGGGRTTCDAVLIRPDAAHEVDARDATALIAFVDAHSELGVALLGRVGGELCVVSPAEVSDWRAALGDAGTLTAARVAPWVRNDLLRHWLPVQMHPAVELVLRHLRAQLGKSEDLSLPTLAGVAGLSSSRLMHVFTESVGVPLRPYLLWLRIQHAAGALMSGTGVTEAAHQAGFSDAAHMTRTFRRMLGATPTEVVRHNTGTQGVTIERT